MNYGRQVLTHPFIVDAAKTAFVPACIYNNTKEDATLLKLFEEPSWNNPVVRIMTHARKDLIPRLSDDWTLGGLAQAMTAALGKAKQPVPTYLELLARETAARKRGVESAAFGMT